MKQIISILLLLLLGCCSICAQQSDSDRNHLRRGNRLYQDSTFVKAEVEYRKALELNPQSTDAMYNLGNSLMMQEKGKEAMEMFESASKIEKDKMKLAQIYHNVGVMLQASKQYAQCIEAYKESLRNNPKDDETRYNLALAQKLLKDQQQQQQPQNQDQQKQDQQEDKKDQNKDQQDQQQQQQQPQQNKNEMSKENAEQLLNAVMQDEKNVQEKVKKQMQIRGKKLEKDW